MNFCPNCQDQEYILKLRIENNFGEYLLVKCKKCNHYYTIRNSSVRDEDLYNAEAYVVDDQRNSIFYKIQKYEYNKVLSKIHQLSNSYGRLLDFGSGKGHFLHFAKEKGFEVVGVETARNRADYCVEKYNIKVFKEYYSGKGKIGDDLFDVITLFHVLEHLNPPRIVLKGLFEDNLKNNGILVVEVPNFNSWQSKISGKYWVHLDISRHINHYTKESLTRLIEDLNGRIIKFETFSLHNGIIGMLQAFLSTFGYRGSLYEDFKFRKNFFFLFGVSFFIVRAFITEMIAAMFKSGGVLRFYIKK